MRRWIGAILSIWSGLSSAQTLSGDWQTFTKHLQSADTLYLINFWATWCRPCVAELPHLQAAAESLQALYPIAFWLISLDFPPEGGIAAQRLLASKRITLRAFWLTEQDPNTWIPNVDSTWDGALPYTLLWPLRKAHLGSFENAEAVIDFVMKHYAAASDHR